MSVASRMQDYAQVVAELDALYGPPFDQPSDDAYQPSAADEEEASRMAHAPDLSGIKELLAMVEGLAADARRNQHVQARGPAQRNKYAGLAVAYMNVTGWLRQEIAKLAGESLPGMEHKTGASLVDPWAPALVNTAGDNEPVELGDHVGAEPYQPQPNGERCGMMDTTAVMVG